MIFTLEGEVSLGAESTPVAPGELAVLTRGEAGAVWVQGSQDARVLVLSGEPLGEPVAAYGPFVMNTHAQIMEAIRDYQTGKLGHLPARG